MMSGWTSGVRFCVGLMLMAACNGRNVLRTAVSLPPKGGDAVGKTKRGKGTKWMGGDGQGIPLGSTLHRASLAEVTLVEGTLAAICVPRQHGGRPRQKPERVIADRAYDSDPLRMRLKARGVSNWSVRTAKADASRPLRMDGTCFAILSQALEGGTHVRLLGNFRRLVVCYERHLLRYQAFFRIAWLLITLRHL